MLYLESWGYKTHIGTNELIFRPGSTELANNFIFSLFGYKKYWYV